MTDSFGLYLHIPFCKSKCPYCDFFSGRGSETEYDAYIRLLMDKIEYWSLKADRPVTSVYFGGGTPSVLGAERLSRVLLFVKEHFHICDNAEITCEINPDTGKSIDFALMKSAGFNRISVGFQSADKKELAALGRIHNTADARLTVQRANSAGIDNVSLDLMMGIPYQTVDSLKKSIDFCAQCGVKHISSYILKIEEETPFFAMRDKLILPDEDAQAELYLFAIGYLDSLGYKQYEISNFSLDGYESRHNSAYWRCGEYVGIGPSAHSFFEGKRFYYGRSLADFAENQLIPDGKGGNEEEFIMLSLRLKSGLSFEEYEKRYKKKLSVSVMEKLRKYARSGYMELNNNRACFTPEGFLVSNMIIADLI